METKTKNIKKGMISLILLNVFLSIFACERFDDITNDKQETLSLNVNYPIVDTGTTIFYDNNIEINEPSPGDAFYGQDANYTGNQPTYKLSNDKKVVIDQVTGLYWTKSAETNGDGTLNSNDKLGWDDLESYVAELNSSKYGGYNDWRVPSIKELYSLILFSGYDVDPQSTSTNNMHPFIDTNFFDFVYGDTDTERIIDAQYWSSTEYVSTTMDNQATVFGVNFADGRIKGYPKYGHSGASTKFLLCVRGNENYGINDYIDNGNGTITDQATGLMWSKDDSKEGMNWQEALAWVQQKNSENYLGHNDWRLPDAKELQSIVDYSRSPATTESPSIDPIFNTTEIKDELGYPNFPFFWSSTTHASVRSSQSAAYVAFGEGLGFMSFSGFAEYELLDVHGAGCQRSDPKVGDPEDYPLGRGPQGDVIRIYNFVRCVRNAE